MEKSARNKLSSGKNLSFAPIATDNNNDARLPGESRRVSRERNSNDKSRRKDDRRRNEENPLNPDSRKSRMEENLNNDVEVKSRHAKSTKNNYSEPMNSFDKGRAKDGNEDEGEKSKTHGDINDGKKDQDLFLPPAPANKTEKCPLCRKQFSSEGKLRHHRSLDHRHKCQHCSRAYLLKPDLLHHVLKAHDRITSEEAIGFTCKQCEERFSDLLTFKTHESAPHVHACHLLECPRSFPERRQLETHLTREHQVLHVNIDTSGECGARGIITTQRSQANVDMADWAEQWIR